MFTHATNTRKVRSGSHANNHAHACGYQAENRRAGVPRTARHQPVTSRVVHQAACARPFGHVRRHNLQSTRVMRGVMRAACSDTAKTLWVHKTPGWYRKSTQACAALDADFVQIVLRPCLFLSVHIVYMYTYIHTYMHMCVYFCGTASWSYDARDRIAQVCMYKRKLFSEDLYG
jgi:hypothetical protein